MYLRAPIEYGSWRRAESLACVKGARENCMRNDQRQFFVYDLEIGARKDGAVIPDMAAVAAVWERMGRGGRTFPIRRGDATLLIGDIQIDAARDVVALLVRLSDKMAPNSVYSDPSAGHFQEHIKVGDQGADLGCHVLISLSPERDFPNLYTCVIERIPGIASDLVRRLLSKLLNFEYHDNQNFYQYPHPNGGFDRYGNPRAERCCPHIELRGRPSDSLVDDINNGTLSSVSLVRTEVATPIGGAAYLLKEASELRLAVDRNNLPANLWQALRQAFQHNARAYPTAKVAYKTPTSNRTVTVEIDTNTGSPLRDLYVESFEISQIFPFLAQSAQRIVPHLADLVIPQLLDKRSV